MMVAARHYTVPEIYRITQQAARTARFLRSTKLGRDLQFRERIMLAVTEVNGCELCSFAHTRFALDAGLAEAEIRALLGGVTDDAPTDQLPAIAFAQHYAETGGHPEAHNWLKVVDSYGEDEALGALAAIRVMMWGNATGIPLSSLRSRLRGRPDPGSSLSYEITTLVGALAVTPAALLHALIATLRKVSVTEEFHDCDS